MAQATPFNTSPQDFALVKADDPTGHGHDCFELCKVENDALVHSGLYTFLHNTAGWKFFSGPAGSGAAPLFELDSGTGRVIIQTP